MKDGAMAALLRLRHLQASEARRTLAEALAAEGKRETELTTRRQDLRKETGLIMQEHAQGASTAEQAAYLRRAKYDILRTQHLLGQDQQVRQQAGTAYAHERAALRAAELMAEQRARQEAKIKARRTQYILEDTCRR